MPKNTAVRLDVFDLLRGFYIFGIIVNHVSLFPNIFVYITGATKLWVSFAEGFFLISGFFIGFLYKDKIRVDFWRTAKKIVYRSFRLYLWTVYLSLLFTYWGNFMPAGSVKESLWIVSPGNFGELIFKTLTFQYQYGWANILPYYSIYLLITPLVLYLLTKGMMLLVVVSSLLVWLFRGQSTYLAIQTMFFGGLLVGFYSEQIRIFWENLGKKKQKLVQACVIYSFIFTLGLCLFSAFYFPKIAYLLPNSEFWLHKNKVLNWYFDKQTVNVGRLLLSPFWHLSLFFIFSLYKKQITRWFGWLLFSYGQNSLYAYIFHAFVIYPIPFFVWTYSLTGFWVNSLITGLSLMLVYVFMHLTSSAFKGKI